MIFIFLKTAAKLKLFFRIYKKNFTFAGVRIYMKYEKSITNDSDIYRKIKPLKLSTATHKHEPPEV